MRRYVSDFMFLFFLAGGVVVVVVVVELSLVGNRDEGRGYGENAGRA